MKVIRWTLFEFGDEAEIKVTGLVGLRMNQKPAAADLVRQVEESQNYVSHKSGSKPSFSCLRSTPRRARRAIGSG
ncbi:hypothetical protein [Acidithrix ferrooxidans]|uniref:hypothetical protein n=1 Tax=Acidithrix ferrooxidans TaxID=1280514 RepID=UPI0006987000|nr:hypothetical protein [Acidithrix ferrooxidans]